MVGHLDNFDGIYSLFLSEPRGRRLPCTLLVIFCTSTLRHAHSGWAAAYSDRCMLNPA